MALPFVRSSGDSSRRWNQRRCVRCASSFAAGALSLCAAPGLAEETLPPESCFLEGSGFSRTYCCYSAELAQNDGCWAGAFTERSCCSPAKFRAGPAAFRGYAGDQYLEDLLRQLSRQAQDFATTKRKARKRAIPQTQPAAQGVVLQHLRKVERRLLELRNESRSTWELPRSVGSGFFLFLVYFVAQEAMRPFLSMQARLRLVQREATSWALFADIYRAAFGRTDFCRCMEGGEFYSNVNTHIRQAGFGKPGFSKTLFNASFPPHHIMRMQNCLSLPEHTLEPQQSVSLMFSTGCVSGDIAMQLLIVQNCILEQQVTKVLLIYDSVFRLSTLGSECHDSEFWQFTMRDVATQYARIVWEIARRPDGVTELARPFQRSFAWSPLRSLESSAEQQQPWHKQCGPHEILGPVVISLRPEASASRDDPAVGPCCTEIGRFWLRLHTAPVAAATQGTLLIIPITFAWWENPFHHVHWWVPALWYHKVLRQFHPEKTDVALVFPHKKANWGLSATARPTTPDRSEPEEWSYLIGEWPMTGEKNMRPWGLHGLHADVLGWLSSRPAKSLSMFSGRAYEQVIFGVPPIRLTVQAPRAWCPQIAAVRRYVQGTRNYRALELHPEAELQRQGLRRLSILQRPRELGRTIVNIEELVKLFEEKFSDRLDVRIISNLHSGVPWTEQFRTVATTDILMAAHGGALGWVWALPHGGAVIELRGRDTPVWVPCAEQWDVDVKEMFGGLASMAGVHHICVQPHEVHWVGGPGALFAEDSSYMKPWNREEDIMVHPARAEKLMSAALRLVAGPLLRCV